MQDKYYTQRGERPDLAALPVSVVGFIADQILPVSTVTEKSGTVYHMAPVADKDAQENRVAGAGPTGTQISSTSKAYACAEISERGKVTPDEAKQMGGIEKADEVGAKFAKRTVLRTLEKKVRLCLDLF